MVVARWLTAVVVGLLLVAGTMVALRGSDGTKELTAYFASTVSLHPGAEVKVLGVPVGSVDDVEAEGNHVRVDMSYDAERPLPEDVHAVIVPPSLIGDRFVQLAPAYSGGDVLPDTATLPTGRTTVPVEIDEIYESLDELATALGPSGANQDGALSELVHAMDENLDGNGERVNDTVGDLSEAVDTLASASPDFADTVSNLASITENLSSNDQRVRDLVTVLADVSTELNDQRSDLGRAVETLGGALEELSRFLDEGRPELATALERVTDTTSTVAAHREELAEALDAAPLALTNLFNAAAQQNWDPAHPERVPPQARTAAVTARGNFLNDLDTQLGHTMTGLCGRLPAEHQQQLEPVCGALQDAGGELGDVLMDVMDVGAGAASGSSVSLGELLTGGQR